jgi:hypothetical protein
MSGAYKEYYLLKCGAVQSVKIVSTFRSNICLQGRRYAEEITSKKRAER